MVRISNLSKGLVGRLVGLAIAIAAISPLSSTARSATVTVAWSAPSAGRTTDRTFATNEEMNGHLKDGALDPKYAAELAQIGFHFFRLHAGTTKEWTTNEKWDPKIIGTELNSPYIERVGDANIIITIDVVPEWCRNIDHSINDAKFAAFCAQLVKITNVDLGHHVKYWEVMNEEDGWPEFANRNWMPYFKLYNECADAMKAVDPTIDIGGPTMSWYDDALADQFLTNCGPNVGFLSWHAYLVESSLVPPLSGPGVYAQVMKKLGRFTQEVNQARATVAKHTAPGAKPIPLDFDEFNICGDWTATGWGMDTNIGAAFFGAVLTRLADAQCNWTANWSAKEGVYGLIDMNDNYRPAAYVYMFANHHLIGSIAQSSSDDPDIYCLAVDDSAGGGDSGDRHAIMLTNVYYDPKTVTLEHGLTPSGALMHVTTIDAAGVHKTTRSIKSGAAQFEMPGLSVAMITMP